MRLGRLKMKKIGILTSGGDAQGMNAAIYSVVRYATQQGLEVFGIYDGYQGLIDGKVKRLYAKDVENIIHRGGTMLGTSRCPAMKTDEGKQQAVAVLHQHGIEGLVVIGGDGSFHGAELLSVNYGIKTMGIPGTIDNDLAYTDFTLGFDTATTVCIDTIAMLRDTMFCNERSCVVEVMGRNCGDIALYSAIASGAEAVILPEVQYDVDAIVNTIKHNATNGKYDNIIVLAEGVAKASDVVAQILQRLPKLNIRPMTVGHIQRGGKATLRDRMLGVDMGVHAVDCLLSGKTNRVIGIRDNKIFDEDIVVALSQTRKFDMDKYNLANKLVKY